MSTTDVEEHVLKNYEIHRRIGKGAYGIVWKSVDRRTGEIVALKKIFDAFTNATDAQRTYREVMFLQCADKRLLNNNKPHPPHQTTPTQAFSSHENVVQLLNIVRATNNLDLYLVFEFMDTDLHAVIKHKLLQPVHHQYVMYQLLKVMKFIHSGHCIHRDLKPSNILINPQCHIKLADFGLARSLSLPPPSSSSSQPDTSFPAMTDYVATRWYRAPEILLGGQLYTTGVDMWSTGCILAEMIAGKPLFPGTSTMNQIERIMAVLPQPSRQDIEAVGAPYALAILGQVLRRRGCRLTQLLPTASDEALDLLTKLLQFTADRRLSAHSAVYHPFVKRFHDVRHEPVLDCDVVLHLDDNTQLPADSYRERLYTAITTAGRNKRARTRKRRDKREGSEEATPSEAEATPTSGRAQSANDDVAPKATSPKVIAAPVKPRLFPSSSAHHKPRPPPPPLHHSCVQTPDLTITSARIIPSSRPDSHRGGGRGGPSRVAMGTYTQTHGTISKSNLKRLLAGGGAYHHNN